MKLIVGLGNPGEQYQKTRHNLGFEVIDHLLTKTLHIHKGEDSFWDHNKKLKSDIGKIEFEGEEVLLAKPQSYMNNSGMAVKALVDFYKVPLGDLIVIHDELDLKLGQIKVRQGGSAAGHHGIESILNHLGKDGFLRVRLGIGNIRTTLAEHGQDHMNVDRFVVGPFTAKEKPAIKKMVKRAVEALEMLLTNGLEKTQSTFH